MTKLYQLKLVQLKEELQKRNFATSGNRGALMASLMEALVNVNKNPDEFEFDDQDVESNAVPAAIDAKIIQQLRELREQFDVRAEQQLAVINAKMKSVTSKMIRNLIKRLSSSTRKTFLKTVRDSDFRQTLILTDKRNLIKDAAAFESQDYGAPKCWNCGKKDIYDEIVSNSLEIFTVL
ncbi:hypothetical protein HELRODRAFT_162984 [Helobdella robusta]|uniref:SAP domain-containing protein n=1 Tax=Helobdella robusta TaxID=6412 RepID=T1ETH8_HELRO|nr:hypothetical protein HELRODRAFT_162984 [Helobdella robusta]ESN99436.1 hypothetical protein HELRODRAFT_162984 [Helobdella robusta]